MVYRYVQGRHYECHASNFLCAQTFSAQSFNQAEASSKLCEFILRCGGFINNGEYVTGFAAERSVEEIQVANWGCCTHKCTSVKKGQITDRGSIGSRD